MTKIKNIVVAGLAALVLASGCKDEKLNECIAKTKGLESEFEEACDGDYFNVSPYLYTIVKKRDEVWKEASCDQYQAKWTCHADWSSYSFGSYYYHAKLDYGRKGEVEE
jgi:hypothetical protein